ncbi:MAG: metalloregulator ArsR/SmtB family transcription factor [Litorimonas sp.]
MISTVDMMPKAEEATRLMKALAHPERLMICCQLRAGEMSVGEIEKTLLIPQPRLSRELGKLREHGILGTRRESKSVFYHLQDKRIHAIVDTLCYVMMTEGKML